MSGIVRQSDQYDIFDVGVRYPKEREARAVPESVIAEYTRGPSIGEGMLNPGNRLGSRRHTAADIPADPNMHPGPTHMPWNGAGAPSMQGPLGPFGGPNNMPSLGGGSGGGGSMAPQAPPAGREPTPVAPGRIPGTNPQIPTAPGFGESPIHVGVNTHGFDPDEHAYHTEDFDPYSPGPGRHFDPNTGYQPSEFDEQRAEAVGDDDYSGYNWGPAPGHDPGAEPGPHPDFHGDAPHPFGTPTYSPGVGHDPYLGSRLGFNRQSNDDHDYFMKRLDRVLDEGEPGLPECEECGARTTPENRDGADIGEHHADWCSLNPRNIVGRRLGFTRVADGDDGDALGANMFFDEDPNLFTPMYFREKQPDQRSLMLGAVPAAPMPVPMMPIHPYLPGHRIGLPYKNSVIPGTVTHLRPDAQVGVRWDDGQHSVESPGDVVRL